MKYALLPIFLGLLLTGCTSLDFAAARSGSHHAALVQPEEVKIYRTERPNGHYQEIGLLHFKGNRSLSTIINQMKREASRQGGNAIIDIKVIPGGAVGTVVVVE